MTPKTPPPQVDVLDQNCPSRVVLDRLAGKWTVLVVYALIDGPKRHGSLRRMIQGISQKMLTQTLRRMEHDGLVKRHVIDRVPPHVEYALTPLGMTLTEPFAALCRWAMEHVSEIERSRVQAVDDMIAKHERELAAKPSTGRRHGDRP